MHLIDTHCHLTFEELQNDIDNVLTRSVAADVKEWITVGTNIEHTEYAITLAQKFDNIYATAGIHPHFAKDITENDLAKLIELAKNKTIVAIGETGLDFHYNFSKQPAQIKLFEQQIKIAAELNLPLIVHSREAFDETIKTLNDNLDKKTKVVFHCFTGSTDQAKIIIDKGFYISFTGVVTFKNARNIRQAVKVVPIEKLMLETDCPYMTPEPVRKHRVNEPAFLAHTAKFLAKLKNTDYDDFTQAIAKTTQKFFNLIST